MASTETASHAFCQLLKIFQVALRFKINTINIATRIMVSCFETYITKRRPWAIIQKMSQDLQLTEKEAHRAL